MTRTIELELDDLTVVDEWQKDEPTAERQTPFCLCGKACELDGPTALAGVPVADWPCARGRRWQYCSTTGRIVYDVR